MAKILSAPKGLTKKHMYDFLDNLNRSYVKDLREDHKKLVRDLYEMVMETYRPELQKLADRLEYALAQYQVIRDQVDDPLSFLLIQSNELDQLSFRGTSSLRDPIRNFNMIFDYASHPWPHHAEVAWTASKLEPLIRLFRNRWGVDLQESPTLLEIVQINRKNCIDFFNEMHEFGSMIDELRVIVRQENYPPKAWRLIQATGLNLESLVDEIQREQAQVPALRIPSASKFSEQYNRIKKYM